LACPKSDPQWELGALHTLMKPKPETKEAIRHRSSEQKWPADGSEIAREARDVVAEQLGVKFEMHHSQGEYHLAVTVPRELFNEGLALGWLLSSRLPDLWFVYGRLFLRNGKFFRRQFGVKLKLVVASNVHLRRGMRAALR
jgi:uncharacterized membrane protein YciS (DUF1049 family)